METQRPVANHILEYQRRRNAQLTIKIKPYSHRPNLLVPQLNTIGVGQGGVKYVRLAGGDLPVGATSESEWYYPTSSGFSANAVKAGMAGEEPVLSNTEGRDPERCGF